MSYIVFARKYRPQEFADITGQSHITTTLKNAISQNRVAHAYIFAGPRGVGKTTAARILAKALNCEKGSTPTPCNKCPSCLEIIQGSSLDVLEIDGASNRGIDEIRNLRDNVKFAPSRGRYKIYIIDEVHMLTPEAFNALLKTLEEPPPHVKFIFATTHAHKVPSTILSRCQRFDFRRLSTRDILENLKAIAKNEALKVKEEALALIARHADGSMRDGQVILDQVVSFSRGAVGLEDATKILGVVGEDILFSLSDAFISKDAPAALKILSSLIDEGKDVVQVLFGLIEHFRNIAVVKVSKDPGSLLDVNSDSAKRYSAASEKLKIEEVLYIISILTNTVDMVRRSNLQRIPFEAAIIKLAQADSIVSLGEMMKRIDRLEKSGSSTVNRQSSIVENPPIVDRPSVIVKEKKEAGSADAANDKRLTINDERTTNDALRTTNSATAATCTASPRLMAIVQGWQKVIGAICPKKMSIASYLQEGSLESVESNTLTMSFANELKFHKEMLEYPENRKLVESTIKDVLGMDLKVDFRLMEYSRPVTNITKGHAGTDSYTEDAPDPESLISNDPADPKDADPIVNSALNMFGGQIAIQSAKDKRSK
ncbi:MAG: DNA polymerase III subunit gamma/tau [Candidatus Omnitrophica bacterium]|nr:DNA polymerase III subunit gamma/tau [Candidatus Omnitrophota bacterium]